MQCDYAFLKIAFISTNSIFSITSAFKNLYLPDKIIFLFFLTYRYIYLLLEEYINIKNALRIKGFRNKWIHGFKTYSNVVATLLIRGFDHANHIYYAMTLRGFNGKFNIIKYSILPKDILFFLLFIYLTLQVFVLQWMI